MSQPSYPSEINARASDEASALSVASTGGGALPDTDTVGAWLRTNDAMAALFVLEKQEASKKRSTNPVWNFFHCVKRVKHGVSEDALPKKWLDLHESKMLMSCNACGELVTSGTIDPKTKKLKQGSITAQGMKSHLQSGKHSTTAEALEKLTGPPPSAWAAKKQSSIASWSKSGPVKLQENG